jgi:TIR domain
VAGKIFLNYRRGDDPGFTQALYQRLEDEFTGGDLFMDVEGHIKPGDDFVEVLKTQVAATDVLLVVIGPRWTDLLAARQGDPDDFVAIEIKAALDQGKRVIPVLVGGAAVPRPDALPEGIRALARRNAVGLRPERFKADCQGLMTALKEHLAAAEQERAARTETERKAAEAARLKAEAQAAARANESEERGRVQAAAGLSADEIRKAEELASWDFVKDRANLQDLRDHLARFPGGTTERYALAKLDSLVWGGLGSKPAIERLRAYLDEFPKGENAAQARGWIRTFESAAEAERAAVEQARLETEAWGAAAASDRTAIEAFLKDWPRGKHADAAKRRLRELDRMTGGGDGLWIGLAAGLAIAALPLEIVSMNIFLDMGWNFFIGHEDTIWLGGKWITTSAAQEKSGILFAAGLIFVAIVSLAIWRRGRLGRSEIALYWLTLVVITLSATLVATDYYILLGAVLSLFLGAVLTVFVKQRRA